MIDNHIHIGQFNEVYYDPVEVIQIVMEKCIEGLCFSSTTTCMEDITYSRVENEITQTLAHIVWTYESVQPFLWYIPAFSEQGVSLKKAMNNLPYKVIKLHPLAHHWDLEEKKVTRLVNEIFEYAGHNKLPVLIHTGNNGIDAAGVFSVFFPKYQNTKFILAHCRPFTEAIHLIGSYPNVYGDTAFLSKSNFQKITKENVTKKIVLGSDFPITNYFDYKYRSRWHKIKSLKKQYDSDFEQLRYFYHFYSKGKED